MLFDDFGNWLYWDSNWDYYSYTGQEYDWPLTDAYNLRAREYYPTIGRFGQNDPIGDKGGSANWYLYVANNPVNWTDITGKVCGSKGNDEAVPDNFGLFDFTLSCYIHDHCYRQCGASKDQCDKQFLNNMLTECRLYQAMPGSYSLCEMIAGIYYFAVHFGGDDAFKNAQCNCK